MELARNHGTIGIAYTYSEPSVWFEYVRIRRNWPGKRACRMSSSPTAISVKKPWRIITPICDGANIDLKSFSEDFTVSFAGQAAACVGKYRAAGQK